jgi:hypothetical protein
MVKDLTDTINVLRCTAVGRCRERLEQAAQKAKGLFNNGQSRDQSERPLNSKDQYGVSCLMKRKHGL